MREGYQPSPEEIGLAQAHLESMTIREEPTEHGFQHLDADGRVVLKTETWDETQQSIQYSYGPGEASVEEAKILEGEKQGQEYRREHPHSQHAIPLSEYGSVNGTLETLGQTTVGGPEGSHEPWAHFEVNDPSTLAAFANIPNEQRQQNERGQSYAVLNGDFGGGFELTVGSRTIMIDRIGRISVDFDTDGRPAKATLHKIIWHEISAEQ